MEKARAAMDPVVTMPREGRKPTREEIDAWKVVWQQVILSMPRVALEEIGARVYSRYVVTGGEKMSEAMVDVAFETHAELSPRLYPVQRLERIKVQP